MDIERSGFKNDHTGTIMYRDSCHPVTSVALLTKKFADVEISDILFRTLNFGSLFISFRRKNADILLKLS